ncbi:WD40 repeat domain-containing protein [Streptomyces sp. NPDC051976]|uniref:WD40 repeat domain-containing protein n=1 Tax=Streptomyces sp. NPDC051976 TaxID=3154947 RepID=UPI0034260A87
MIGDTGRSTAVAVSPDGTWFVTGDSSGTVRIWDVRHLPGPAPEVVRGSSLNGWRSSRTAPG